MKIHRIPFGAVLFLFLAMASYSAKAQLSFGWLSNDQMTGKALEASDRNAVILIHGWNPDDIPNMFIDGNWPPLVSSLQSRLTSGNWKLLLYHWEEDASTGPAIDLQPNATGFSNARKAAGNALYNGAHLAALLNDTAPQLRKIVFVAHSAGSWAAYRAADHLLQHNPYVVVNVVLLDPFVPGVDPSVVSPLNTATMGLLATHPSADRIYRIENYYANDATDFDFDWGNGGGSRATSQVFSWRGRDINQRVDYNSGLGFFYDGHGGPISFYADSALATIGTPVPNGQAFAPWSFTSIGFYRGLVNEGFLLPSINTHPQSQTVNSGASVSLNVSATSSQTLSYQWYKNGQPISGANGQGHSFTALAGTVGDYVVRVSNVNGLIFSEKASVRLDATTAPTISSVTPRTFTGPTKLIAIMGTGFTSDSRLTFNDGVNPPYTDRVPASWTPTQLTYDINVGSNPATWTLRVVNGAVESLPYSFYVVSGTAQLTSLGVSGPAAIPENASGQFTATAYFSDGSQLNVTSSASWSENSSATTISSSGLLNGGSVNSDTAVTVSASYTTGGITKSANANATVVNSGNCGTVQANPLVNGNFETLPLGTGWTLAGAIASNNGDFARTGTYFLWLGGAVGFSDSGYQTINIPSTATSAILSFYYNINSLEGASVATDTFTITVRNTSGSVLATIANLSNRDQTAPGSCCYTLRTFDLLPYAGQTIRIHFASVNNATLVTNFRVDDVSVAVTSSSPVTPVLFGVGGPTIVAEGSTAQYSAIVVNCDGSIQSVTPTWSDNSNATSISSSGLLTAGSVSSDTPVTITATYSGFAPLNYPITIVNSAASFSYLAISGPSSISETSSGQFTATAIFSDGSSQSVSPSWSENSAVTTISGGGLLTTGEVSTDTVVTVSATATIDGVTRSANQEVLIVNSMTLPTLTALSISGPNSLNESSTAQYTATASFSDGSSQTVNATWSEDSAATSISVFGLLSAGEVVSDTPVTLSASYTLGGVSRSAQRTLTVLNITGPVNYTVTVSVSPSAGGTVIGNGTFAAGTSQTVTALANSGYTFLNWTDGGTIVSTSASYPFTLNGDRNLVANFAPGEVCVPVASGLVAWWKGISDGGDSQSGNTGDLHSVQLVSGKVGNGFEFSGTGSFIEIADDPTLHTPSALTLEMWIKPTEANAYHYLFTKAGVSYKDWNLYLWKGGLHAEFLDASSTRNEDGVGLDTPDGIIGAGVFSHIALTLNTQTHVAEIFVNGVSVIRGTLPTISTLRVTAGDVFVGSSSGGATTFQGIMDEVSLYNRALTLDEIRAIYEAGSAGKCPQVRHGISFQGGTSGYHNTGGTTRSLPFTVSGSDTILVVGWGHDGNGHVTSVTYDGIPMVSLGTQAFDTVNPQNFNVGMFYLLNPHSGTHDLVLTRDIPTSTMDYTVALYTGVDQTRTPEMLAKGATAAVTDQPSATMTTTCNDCWVVGAVNVDKSIVLDSANLKLREQSPDQTTIFDSDGPLTAGSHTFSWKLTEPGHSGWIFATLTPVAQTVATPTISPDSGTFVGQAQVTLTCTTPGATIRYTIDGTDPTASSSIYANPLTLTASATVKAKAFAPGYNESAIASGVFTITAPLRIITATAGANGSVAPNGETTKASGESLTLTATPSQGYEVDQWLLDGTAVQTGGATFIVSNIQANHTVQVSFKEKSGDGLLAYYLFNGDFSDSTGNGFDGINFGATWDADRNGTINSAAKFAGTGNWVKLPIGASHFSQDFSIALWLKLDDFAAQYPAILNGDTGFIRLEAAGPLYTGEGNYQKIKFYQLGQSQVWSGTTFDTGRWYHLAIVRAGTNYRIYVNGALSGENDMPAVNVSGTYLQMGNDSLNTFGGAYFHGSLDDLRFYGQALSPTEVQELFAGPPSIPHLNSVVVGNGALHCVLRGPAGASVLIESSTDLANWTLVRTHLLPVNGSMEITLLEQIDTETSGKFYRARLASSPSAPFSDDFNRTDSATVGNGWLNAPSDGAYHLVLKDGRLSVDPNEPTETGAVISHSMPPLPATVSLKFTDKNGFGSLRNRYQSSVAVLYNPATGKGYGLQFTRADQNFNDSKVTIWDGDTTVATIPCSFQFGTEISVNASFKTDGSILGTIQSAENSFPFSVAPRAIESSGANVMIGLNRSGSGTILPTADDFAITSP